jgi:hypothetical protein
MVQRPSDEARRRRDLHDAEVARELPMIASAIGVPSAPLEQDAGRPLASFA